MKTRSPATATGTRRPHNDIEAGVRPGFVHTVVPQCGPKKMHAPGGQNKPPKVAIFRLVLSALFGRGRLIRPDRLGGLNDQTQFRTLVRLGDGIARDGRGEPALRTDGETIDVDESRRVLYAPLQ